MVAIKPPRAEGGRPQSPQRRGAVWSVTFKSWSFAQYLAYLWYCRDKHSGWRALSREKSLLRTMDVSTSSTRSCTRRGSPPGPPSWPRCWRPPTPRPRSPAPPASPGCVTPPSDGGSSASPSPTRGCGHTGRFRDEKYLLKSTENICSSSVQIPSWQQCLENTSSEDFMRLPQGSVDIMQEFLTLSSTSSIK